MNRDFIKTSTYMKLTELMSEGLHELYLTTNADRMNYRADVLVAISDIVRRMADVLPEEKGQEFISDLQSAMLRAAHKELMAS